MVVEVVVVVGGGGGGTCGGWFWRRLILPDTSAEVMANVGVNLNFKALYSPRLWASCFWMLRVWGLNLKLRVQGSGFCGFFQRCRADKKFGVPINEQFF